MSNGWRKLIIVEIIREQLELLTLIHSREIAALKPSTVLLLTALSVSVFQSFTGLAKKECVYISVVAESTLICLLLDVLDGRWLYCIQLINQ
jgi:hypothetical protein